MTRLTRRRFFALTAGTAVLSACSPGTERSTSDPKHVELIVPNFPQLLAGVQQALDAAFTKRTGISVTLVRVGDTSYTGVDQRLQNDLIAGRVPDLAITGLNSLRTYADAKRAAALDQVIKKDETFAATNVDPRLLDLGRFHGTLYGFPYGVSTYTLFCNADVFRKAHLDPAAPPQTFTELRRAATAIVSSKAAANGIIIRTDHLGGYGFQNLLRSAGGAFTNPAENHATFNSPQGAEIIGFWADLVKAGAARAVANQQAGDIFTRGDTGMVLQSSSYSATIQSQVKFEVRSAPFPIPDHGTRKAVAGGAAIVSFAKDPAKLAAQWTVIKELTSPRGVTALVKASGFSPVNRAAAADPRYLGGYLETNPLAKAGWSQLAALVPWYQFPGTHNVEIGQVMQDEIAKAVAGATGPQAALDNAATRVKALLP